ncbi:MAG: DUF5809 family protein [Halobacteriales archaeon]
MHTRGSFAPETATQARERYEAVGPTAQILLKQVAKAMKFDSEEYERRVTSEVVETAREVLFAADLHVRVGTREEYENWLGGREYEVTERGNPNVSRVAWHAAPFAEAVVAATFEHEEDAAVETLRRQAFGSVYRGIV